MRVSVKVKTNFKDARIAKQVPFATAVALTNTVKDAQKDIIDGLDDKFTLRSQWYSPRNKFGIRVKTANKRTLSAEVGTDADWLEKFETGKDKTPKGSNLAIPTSNVRRTKRQIIQKSQRPASLRGKRDVVLKTRSGPVLFQRKYRGKRSYLLALYNLEKIAKIRKNSPVIEPALHSIGRNLPGNFIKAMEMAIKTAK